MFQRKISKGRLTTRGGFNHLSDQSKLGLSHLRASQRAPEHAARSAEQTILLSCGSFPSEPPMNEGSCWSKITVITAETWTQIRKRCFTLMIMSFFFFFFHSRHQDLSQGDKNSLQLQRGSNQIINTAFYNKTRRNDLCGKNSLSWIVIEVKFLLYLSHVKHN